MRAKLNPFLVMSLDILGEGGEWSATTAARAAGCPREKIYYWFRELKTAGMIEEVRAEPSRGSVEHFFVLT